jgi:hypothetical protein
VLGLDLAQAYGRKNMTDEGYESEMIDETEDDDDDDELLKETVATKTIVTVEEAVAEERANIARQLTALVSRASSANPLAEPLKSLIRKLETS